MRKIFETMTFGDHPTFLDGTNCIVIRGTQYFHESEESLLPTKKWRNRNIWISLGGKHRVQGDASVATLKFMEIPETALAVMYDPTARTYSGLLNQMRAQHPDFQEDEEVSILCFTVNYREPKVGHILTMLVDIPENERRYDYQDGDKKIDSIEIAITEVKSLGNDLWEITDGERTGIVHSAESNRWDGQIYWTICQ